MSVKHSIFIALLGIAFQLDAKTLPNSFPNLQTAQSKGGYCNDPAPASFHVISIGPTWVDLGWISANPLNWHRIKTYRTSNNQLVSNLLLPPGNAATVNGLDEDEAYYSRINVVCEDGNDSGYYAEVGFHTIIAELLVLGYDGASNTADCTIRKNANNACTFLANGSLTNFQIRLTNTPSTNRKFRVSKPAENRVRVSLTNNNDWQNYVFYCDGVGPNTEGQSYQVVVGGVQIAAFNLTYQPSTTVGVLTCTDIHQDYEIVRIQQSGLTPGGGDRSNLENKAINFKESSISVAPNPFSESLVLTLSDRPEGQVKIQLFNLSGQKVLEQQYEPAQEQYTLRTTGLPSGFYMLRVEADGEVQTLKVVKSE